MKKTVVLYQHPAADGDLRLWEQRMIERGKLVLAEWESSSRPLFWVSGPDGEERVLCFPMSDLIEDSERIPLVCDKIVIIGAVEQELREAMAIYLTAINK